MCTVLLAWRRIDGWPLILANNRDEFYARRALPPRVYRGPGGRRWIACRDLRNGGSWWGWNEAGLMVWLTNRWTGAKNNASDRRSRGLLVVDLLVHAADAGRAAALLKEWGSGMVYNPFNLLLVTAEHAFLVTNFPVFRILELRSGFHFLGNGELLACPATKARSARRVLAELARQVQAPGRAGRDQVLSCFRRALSTPFPHDTIPPQGFNVRFPDYGTSASLLLACPAPASVNTVPEPPLLLYCDGNPLFSSYQDYGALVTLL